MWAPVTGETLRFVDVEVRVMSRRHRIIRDCGVGLVLAFWFGFALVAERAAASVRCGTSGHTVASNRQSRVFSRHDWVVLGGERVRAELFFGCSRDTGKIFVLKSPYRDPPEPIANGPSQEAFSPRLNARFFLLLTAGLDSQAYWVDVWNLRTGHNTYEDELPWESDVPYDIEVGAHGGVAWIEPYEHQVTKLDSSGQTEVGHADGRLTVDGDTVLWRDGGELRSYELQGRARRVQ
jgi:hypothetical protein